MSIASIKAKIAELEVDAANYEARWLKKLR
jgi:hypothetical protein